MKLKTVLVAVMALVLLSLLLTMAMASDDQGNPNTPTVNERANACYDDGSLAGKCGDSEWAWTCGWYLIRFEAGLIPRAQFPQDCSTFLPSTPAPTATPFFIA